MLEIALGIVLFVAIVMLLVGLVLVVRSRLVATGRVRLTVNDGTATDARVGTKLLEALGDAGIHLPAACGGMGTCGQCRLWVLEGGGAMLPTERTKITRREEKEGARLACQVTVKQDMAVRVPDEIFGVRQWQCVVRSNDNVATMIKELVLDLPPGESMDYRAGAYVQIDCPPCSADFRDFDIASEYRGEWDRLDLWRYTSVCRLGTTRAYSLASYPDEKGVIMLNVRIALPPPGSPDSVPPGAVSSFLFSLKPGDTVTVSGPYGHFFATGSDREMVFVGGGAGMAPMRSHILDQLKRLKSGRKITFWYGARSDREMFYVDELNRLAEEHENFSWTAALSDPRPEDHWTGKTGFIHEVLREDYLNDHPAPEDCEYYICGPPMMLRAVLRMLDNLGVDPDTILYDEF